MLDCIVFAGDFGQMLPLLETCQQIYMECTPLFSRVMQQRVQFHRDWIARHRNEYNHYASLGPTADPDRLAAGLLARHDVLQIEKLQAVWHDVQRIGAGYRYRMEQRRRVSSTLTLTGSLNLGP